MARNRALPKPFKSRSARACGIVKSDEVAMIDHEKFQKGRMWAYLAGSVLFAIVTAVKLLSR
jgi:hypothetical protein